MRSCLGTFNYWRGYIRKFSDIVAPLVAVTRKNVLWIWRDDVEGEAVRTLKQALLDSPVLIPPNSDKPYHAVTAASDYAVGASLEQEEGGEGSRCRPVAFFSHSLNPAERKYPTHERELLGIVLALRTWRVYLFGSEFSIYCYTDHRPLQHFLKQTTLSSRQVRWQQYLSEYNLAISYVPGKANVFADGLSRRPDLKLMVVGALGGVDATLKEICEGVQQKRVAKKCWNAARAATKTSKTPYVLMHGVLYYKSAGLYKVYVPDFCNLRRRLISQYHDVPAAGHFREMLQSDIAVLLLAMHARRCSRLY